jgi:uncharacterized coiled-coil protein SlyX
MKDPKKPLSSLPPGWNTSHGEPRGQQYLNEHRLRELEEARIACLPQTILHLEERIVSLHKQLAKAERLLAEARKEFAKRSKR